MKSKKIICVSLIAGALTTVGLSTVQPWPTKAVRSPEIRRTILLRFKPETTPEQIRKILKEVRANISSMKGVSNVIVGAQIIDRIPFTYGISMDFDDEAALKAYRQDQEHRRTHNDYSHLIEQAQISDIRTNEQ